MVSDDTHEDCNKRENLCTKKLKCKLSSRLQAPWDPEPLRANPEHGCVSTYTEFTSMYTRKLTTK